MTMASLGLRFGLLLGFHFGLHLDVEYGFVPGAGWLLLGALPQLYRAMSVSEPHWGNDCPIMAAMYRAKAFAWWCSMPGQYFRGASNATVEHVLGHWVMSPPCVTPPLCGSFITFYSTSCGLL
jgi:hypothetical protein